MKQCTMNCGPAAGDMRSEAERRAECTDCVDVAEPDKYLEADEFLYTVAAMGHFGGNFAHYIARAGIAADSHNRHRLQDAFPDLFEKYGPKSAFYKKA